MKLSEEELASGTLNPETLELAVNLIKVNGYVLFEEVLPRFKVNEINGRYIELLEPYLKKYGDEIYDQKTGFNAGTNHIRLYLPFELPFIDPLVIEHPLALAVIDQILGENCILDYFATNTSLPGGINCQQVHSDTGAVYGDLCSVNLPISQLVVNIPLVDVHANNGPMEIWPGGTHLLPDNMYGPNAFDKNKLAPHMQSLKVFMPAGSIVIRDIRMWHRGTPNKSNQPRPNIAMIYSLGKGSPGQGSIQIPQDTYDKLSERAKRLLRFEKISCPVIEPTHK
jgi:ectoine hydroxylase-related dioxygenase (phytanoyl-CoA dioxygenase family)